MLTDLQPWRLAVGSTSNVVGVEFLIISIYLPKISKNNMIMYMSEGLYIGIQFIQPQSSPKNHPNRQPSIESKWCFEVWPLWSCSWWSACSCCLTWLSTWPRPDPPLVWRCWSPIPFEVHKFWHETSRTRGLVGNSFHWNAATLTSVSFFQKTRRPQQHRFNLRIF